jgi:predicted nucleic acid-binding protein
MICFDTMILVWGVQGAARSAQEEMIERTRRYLRSLQEGNTKIMVPTAALTEYLQGFELEDRKRQLQALERHFVIPAFDLPAAYLAAGLARKAGNVKGIPRQTVKTDIQIIATAIVNRAERIITDERAHFEQLADGKIEISEVPTIHEQSALFDV